MKIGNYQLTHRGRSPKDFRIKTWCFHFTFQDFRILTYKTINVLSFKMGAVDHFIISWYPQLLPLIQLGSVARLWFVSTGTENNAGRLPLIAKHKIIIEKSEYKSPRFSRNHWQQAICHVFIILYLPTVTPAGKHCWRFKMKINLTIK